MNRVFKEFYSLLVAGVLFLTLMAGCGGGGGGGGNAGTTETTSPPKTYTLTVDKFGEGIVTSDISGVNCGDDCSEAHNEGTTVVLTASSGTTGYQFSSWAGCDSATGNTCTITMDRDKSVLPSFIREPILYATTKILDDATLQYLVRREGSTFYFDSRATMASNVIPGDIIAGSTEMGFLRKVTAVYTSQEGLIVIETSDATLEEAIQEGSVTFTKELTHTDLMSSKMQEGISLRKASPIDRESNKVFTFDFDNLVYDQAENKLRKATPFEWTSDANVKISGSVELTFIPDFGLDLFIKEWWGIIPKTGVKEFKTILLATQKNNLKITTEGKASVSSGKIKIGTLKFTPIQIHPIFWLTPEFNIYIGLDGSVEAALSTSATLTNYVTAGIRYTNVNGWEPKGDYSRAFSLEQPTLTSGASIVTYVIPEGVFWIDGLIGPYINLKGYLGLDATATANLSSYELFWRLYCGIDAEAGVKAEIIGISLPEVGPVDLLDPNPEWDIASGGIYSLTVSKNGTGTGTVTSSPTGISCGNDCSKNYNSGTSVTLTQSASTGSTFAGWSGGGCSGTGSCTVTMDAAKTVTATFTVTSSSTPALSITTTSLPSATVGIGYAQGVAVSGGQTPYTWSVSSGLPSGLNINSTTGAIYGTPSASGTFSFSVTVTDSSSPQKTTSKALSLTVSPGAVTYPTISYVSPNPATATGSAQPFTITGSNFVSGATVTLRTSGGGVYANRPISSQSETQIVINPNFGTISDTWTVEVINPGSVSSGQFTFTVQAQTQTVTPYITSVSPNPATATGSAQPFTITGSNFVSGATVTLRTSGGGVYANRSISSQSETQIVINPNFGTISDTWTVEVINPGSVSSGQFTFTVRL